MILNPAQTVLFAVADNSDSVVIVDTAKDRILTEIKTMAPAAMLGLAAQFQRCKSYRPGAFAGRAHSLRYQRRNKFRRRNPSWTVTWMKATSIGLDSHRVVSQCDQRQPRWQISLCGQRQIQCRSQSRWMPQQFCPPPVIAPALWPSNMSGNWKKAVLPPFRCRQPRN